MRLCAAGGCPLLVVGDIGLKPCLMFVLKHFKLQAKVFASKQDGKVETSKEPRRGSVGIAVPLASFSTYTALQTNIFDWIVRFSSRFCAVIQGDFVHWASSEKLKYRKPWLD